VLLRPQILRLGVYVVTPFTVATRCPPPPVAMGICRRCYATACAWQFFNNYIVLLTVKQGLLYKEKNSMSHQSYQNRLQPNINLRIIQ